MWHHAGEAVPPPFWRYLLHPPDRGEYVYFEGARPDRSSPPLHWAGWMMDASLLAYGHYQTAPIPAEEFVGILWNAGFTEHALIGDWSAAGLGTQGFFAANGEYAVLAFRGTEPDDWRDLLVDAFVAPVPVGLLSASAVHGGFRRGLDDVWAKALDRLNDYAARHPQSPIYFTGHSLGAALATLAFARWNRANSQLFTFGSPRVGNAAFCAPINASGRVHRYVNGKDLVTHVPAADLFYVHSNGGWAVADAGISQIAAGAVDSMPLSELKTALEAVVGAVRAGAGLLPDAVAPDVLRDHSGVRYCCFLWDAVRRA